MADETMADTEAPVVHPEDSADTSAAAAEDTALPPSATSYNGSRGADKSSASLHVKGLTESTKIDDLKSAFSRYGTIKDGMLIDASL